MAEPGTFGTVAELRCMLSKPPYNVKHEEFIEFLTTTSDYQGSDAGRYTLKEGTDYEAPHAIDLFFQGNCTPRSVTTRLPVVIKGVDRATGRLRGGTEAKEQGWFAKKRTDPHRAQRMAVALVTPDAARISLCDQLKREYRPGGWVPIDYEKLYKEWKDARPRWYENLYQEHRAAIEKKLREAKSSCGPGRSRGPRTPPPRESLATPETVFDALFTNAASNALRRRVYDHVRFLGLNLDRSKLKNWEWAGIENKLRRLGLNMPDRYRAQAAKNNATVAARATRYHNARKGNLERVKRANWGALPGGSFPASDAQKLSIIQRYLGGNAVGQSQSWHHSNDLISAKLRHARFSDPRPTNKASVEYKKEAYRKIARREAERQAAQIRAAQQERQAQERQAAQNRAARDERLRRERNNMPNY